MQFSAGMCNRELHLNVPSQPPLGCREDEAEAPLNGLILCWLTNVRQVQCTALDEFGSWEGRIGFHEWSQAAD